MLSGFSRSEQRLYCHMIFGKIDTAFYTWDVLFGKTEKGGRIMS
jgi:hypothetical protein